jgi:methyl-accepting chemotaxis protein
MKLTLVRRFMWTCAALLLMCCSITGVSVFCMMRTHEAIGVLKDYSVPGLVWAARLKAVAKDQRVAVILHLSSNDPAEMQDLEAKVEQANVDLAEARKNYPRFNAEDTQQLEIMAREQQKFTDIWYRIRDLSRAGNKQEAWNLYKTEMMQATLGRRKVEDYLATTSNERGKSTAAGAVTLARRGIPIVIIFAAISVILGVLLTRFTALHARTRLLRLNEVADHLADGDIASAAGAAGDAGALVTAGAAAARDEIERLARSFTGMVEYMRETSDASAAIAGGDLTHELQPRASGDVLGHAFVSMTEGLRALVVSVRDSAVQVASGSTQVADASGNLARVSVEASSALEEITSTTHEMSINLQTMVKNAQVQSASFTENSASIDQMVASIQRVADTCQELLEISRQSRDEVKNGISCTSKTAEGLSRINDSILSSAEMVDALGNRANDIGRIVEVIDDIAEQTNLLALNAAIEAARAGEHGLGFAVVADEIRKLAERSAQSTNEISALIQSIQAEVQKAVGNMDKSTAMVNEGLVFGSDARTALQKISAVVEQVYSCAQQISSATNEQSSGSSQIARVTSQLNHLNQETTSALEEQAEGAQGIARFMDRMRLLVQQSSSGSAELAASAEQMSRMSSNLLSLVDRFKLHDTHVPVAPQLSGRRMVAAAAAGAQGRSLPPLAY